MPGGAVYVPRLGDLRNQQARLADQLQMGGTTLQAELHRLPPAELAALIQQSADYRGLPQEEFVADLLTPMDEVSQQRWVARFVETARMGPVALKEKPASDAAWLPEDTRLIRLGRNWFISLAFDVPVPRRDHGGIPLGIDVGIHPLATAAGYRKSFSSRPLHLLTGAGLKALERHIGRLPDDGGAHVREEYSRLQYATASLSLETLTTQIIASASMVAVEKLVFKSFSSTFVSRGRELAIVDWHQAQLPQRLYQAKIKLVRVDPAYTSLICHRCGRLGRRNGDQFSCRHCGISLDSHTNASHNIRRRGARLVRGRP